jgi:lipopolysaccharide exporter
LGLEQIKKVELQFVKSLLRNSLVVFSGTFLAQVFILLSLLFLTKIYPPESFGQLGGFQAVVGILWVFATLRYDLSVSLVRNTQEKSALLFGSIALVITFSAISLLLIWLTSGYIFRTFGDIAGLMSFRYWVPVGIFALSVYSILEYYLVGEEKYLTVAIAKIVQALTMCGLQFLLSMNTVSGRSLIIGYAAGYLLSIITVFVHEKHLLLLLKQRFNDSLVFVYDILRKYNYYPKVSFPSALANLASTNLPLILVDTIYSAEVAGHFFMAQRIIGTPIDLVTSSLSQVFLGSASSMLNKQPHELKSLYIKSISKLFVLAIIPFVSIFILSEPIIGWVFGNEWLFTGSLISMFTFMYFARLISMPLSQMLNILNRMDVQLFWDLLRLVSVSLLFFFAWYFSFKIHVFVIAFSVIMSILYLFHAYLGYYFLMYKIQQA